MQQNTSRATFMQSEVLSAAVLGPYKISIHSSAQRQLNEVDKYLATASTAGNAHSHATYNYLAWL